MISLSSPYHYDTYEDESDDIFGTVLFLALVPFLRIAEAGVRAYTALRRVRR